MTYHAYQRLSPKNRAQSEHRQAVQALFPEVTWHQEQGVRGNVPASERPVLSALLAALQTGDVLALHWIACLGRDIADVVQVITALLEKGVVIETVVQRLRFSPADPSTQAMLQLLAGMAEQQTRRRLVAAEWGREALREDKESWNQRFKGRPADKKRHRQIAELLLEGETLQACASKTGASLSTVKRVKARMNAEAEGQHCPRAGHAK